MFRKKKVVIAEDDESIVGLVRLALHDEGFICLHAWDGEEALQLIRLYTPDLLVLDVMMPRMDGIEVAQRLKQDELLAEMPVLMLTALSDVDDRVEGLQAGADAYMGKPFDVREFAAQIHALLRSSQHGRERNPVTELPGPGPIEARVEQVLDSGDEAAVIHIKVCEFEDLWRRGNLDAVNSLLSSLNDLLQEQMITHVLTTAFIGHLGGADFIIIVPAKAAEDVARSVVEIFDNSYKSWLPSGPLMDIELTMAVAVADIKGLQPGDVDPIAERLRNAMAAARKTSGSRCVIWTPS